ncbi:MAG: DUF2306 domain-containing protein [Cytophagales bacterium]|nr:DUF2306 domain-containing protein [Cytophagales bacterium]
MILGSIVLLKPKGTVSHKRIGYAYVVSMLLLNGTAFGMHTFGTFGPFHFAAVMSLACVLAGIIPAIRRKNNDWLKRHYYYMGGSVIGLYAAFWAEVGTRAFDNKFFWLVVVLASTLTTVVGVYVMRKQAKTRFQ